MRLFHRLYDKSGTLLATGEHMLLHVDMTQRRASQPTELVAANLAKMAADHATLAMPDAAGRAVGMTR
jgi:carnitine 3-dehydrogenase